LSVIAGRDGGDFARTRRLGAARFEQAVRREITRRGGQKPCLRIVRGLFSALADPAGVIAHRAGALERVQLLMEDWQLTKTRLNDTERPMTGVLDELRLTALATSITGLSPAGAAAILAETGDPRRFATGRAVVKHAGLAPRGKAVRRVHRPDPADRPGTPRAAAGSLAGGLGSPACQPRLPGPLPAPDQQGAEQAHAHPGADHHRRRDLAATARRHHHRTGLGSGHRGPRHPAAKQGTRRLTLPGGPSSWRPGRALRGIETPR
jgi:hypothetical protein